MSDALNFYRAHSPSTDPGEHADLLDGLPSDLPGLHKVVQNVLIHVWKIRARHPHLIENRALLTHSAHDMLAQIRARDSRPLTEERPLEGKLIVDCRHFAALLVVLLRHQGVPARSRCGFGVYLEKGLVQDHYVAEYWNTAENRWMLEDPDIVMHDVARDQFIVAGQAWRDSRAGNDDPVRFACGEEWRGFSPIRFNVIKDLAMLNKDEEMSMASWGLNRRIDDPTIGDHDMLIDEAARHTLADNDGFDTMRAFYQAQPLLKVEPTVLDHDYVSHIFFERPSI